MNTQDQAAHDAICYTEQLTSIEKMLKQSQQSEARLHRELTEARERENAMETSRDKVEDMIQRSAKLNTNHANRVRRSNCYMYLLLRLHILLGCAYTAVGEHKTN